MSTLKKLLNLLTKQERKRVILLIGMTMIMALLDMVGMASIMPFISVLANPQLVESNFFLNTAYKTLDFVDPTTFLFFLGLVAFTLLIVSLTFKAFYIYLQTSFALLCEYSIGKRLVEGYLHQPYSWFLNRHSAELGKTILSEVSVVIATGIMPLLTLIAQVVVTITLMILLLVVDPLLAFSVFLLVGFAYGIIFTVTRGWLKQLGGARISANQERYTVISEAFSASKEVKVGGLENVYIHPFVLCTAIVCKNTFILLGFVACSIFIIIFTHKFFFLSIIFIIFYLLLFFITSISLTLIIATLCLRYRDLQHATNVILNLLFFFTPIIWSTDQLSEPNKRLLVDTNIIYHYVEFFRSSLFNGHPEIISFLVVIISTTVLFLLALYTSSKFSKKLVFWLL